MRLDLYLSSNGLSASRSRAQSVISSGFVLVNGKKITKASYEVSETDDVSITGDDNPYVSRGGLKLNKALECFDVSACDKICADLGASTGGFTDVLLKHGASFVYSIDSGHDQLHESLKNNSRVSNMEGINARDLTKDDFDKSISLVVTDVSFISLTHILPSIYNISTSDMDAVCLIKPQFEAGRENIGKKGVVKDKKVHIQVIENIYDFCINTGFVVEALTYSPIRGPEGNIEYLIHLKKNGMNRVSRSYIKNIVSDSFNAV